MIPALGRQKETGRSLSSRPTWSAEASSRTARAPLKKTSKGIFMLAPCVHCIVFASLGCVPVSLEGRSLELSQWSRVRCIPSACSPACTSGSDCKCQRGCPYLLLSRKIPFLSAQGARTLQPGSLRVHYTGICSELEIACF